MKCLLLFILLGFPFAALAAAPFCVVSSAGSQCFYWDLNSCRQVANSMQGMCSANPQAMQPTVQQAAPVQYVRPHPIQVINQPNFAESYNQGLEMGMRRRQAKQAEEEHGARMRLLEAQTQAVQSQPAQTYAFPNQEVTNSPAASKEIYRVVYRCGPEGSSQYTAQPAPGCVVISVSQ